MKIGAKIRKIRENRGFTQQVLADHLGVHRTNYSRIENDAQKLTPLQIKKFCELCDVSADFLLEIETNNKVVYSSESANEIQMKLDELNVLWKHHKEDE